MFYQPKKYGSLQTTSTWLIFFLFTATSEITFSQNETNKWYFGNQAGLDFMTSPPTVLTNGAMSTIEGCATISDAAGNLLFYTNGINVWNQNHIIMDNGSGLTGNSSSSQSAIIAKQPGNSNIYYIFTQSGPSGAGAAYSIVDMQLAAGMGSVTIKNVMLSFICTEKLTSVKHSNGIDTWVIFHDWNSADFKSFLLTSAGVNTVAVVSTVGSMHTLSNNYAGCMKTSPNGKKLAVAVFSTAMELFDFDSNTGVITNSLSLMTASPTIYGCEFSPDGTKLYGSVPYANGSLYQWDLCAGDSAAIIASRYTVFTSTAGIAAMQSASDGKIYAARYNQNVLGIINNPNLPGAACNYVDLGLSIAPKSTIWSIPNFITSLFKAPSPPFSFSVNCNTATFAAPVSCKNATCSLTGQLWNFGDTASGTANTSTLSNPTHVFSVPGSYTTQLILNYSCGGGTDTLAQTVIIVNTAPTLSITGNFTICSGEKQTYSVTGADTYSWSNGAATPSISPVLTSTTIYTVTGTSNGCTSQTIFTVTVSKCSAIKEQSASEDKIANIYPNPNTEVIYIENKTKVRIIILNQTGQIILQDEFEPGENKMDIRNLIDGIYFLKTISESGTNIRRLVKTSR